MVPALAVAAALRDSGAQVEFVGGERAEAELVPAAGFAFHPLTVEGIDRRNPLKAARAVVRAAGATLAARRLLKRLGADAVMGGGGYVAAPVGLAARSLGLPVVATEADSHLGITNRLLARFARDRVPGLPDRGPRGRALPRRGPPAARGDRAARTATRPAGSSASSRARRACWCSAGRWARAGSTRPRSTRSATGLPVTCCTPAAGATTTSWPPAWTSWGPPPHYHLHAYIDPFADALAAADLVVARSGGSVLEVAAAGLPSVLVPYPHATADHQTLNARHMERAGAAVVVADAELDGPRLAHEVAALLGSPDRMAAMGRAAAEMARPDAARVVADELLSLAGIAERA